ncbi:MAG: DUF481 domain-containing protein [Halioglobus sp.]
MLSVLLSLNAQASRKTDVIKMYNGDQITGEIISLEGGILEVSTDFMGRLRIEWPEIAALESEYHYELRLSDGERLYGSFHEESIPGQIALVDIFGKHEIEWLQVVEIRPIEENFLDRLDIYLSTTFSYTKATDLGQVSFNTNISYEDEKSRNTLSGRTDITTTSDDDARSSRYDIERWVWNEKRSDSFRSIFANYEDNDELALNRRIGAGAGVGRYWIDTHKTRFTGTTGVQLITEKFIGEEQNQDVELYLSTTFSTWKFTTPELNIDVNFTVYPSITDGGRVRTDGNIRIRWELVEDLFWDVTAWVTTDNQSDTNESTDYSVSTGIGWDF